MKQKQITRIGIAVSAIVIALALWWAFNGAGWTHAATPTGATYDVWARGMIAERCGSQCAQYAPQYVADTWNGNVFWLKPLLDKTNARFPKDAPLTADELTRYALVRAFGIARTAQDDCEKNLVRDFVAHSKFPSASDFKACDFVHSEDYWKTSNATNIATTTQDFENESPFKVDEWDKSTNFYYLLKADYCNQLPAYKCF